MGQAQLFIMGQAQLFIGQETGVKIGKAQCFWQCVGWLRDYAAYISTIVNK